MKRYKKLLSLLLVITTVISAFTISINANNAIPDTTHAVSVCLYNTNTDKNILSQNMQKRIFPTGAVKMMTGLIACEMLSDRLDESFTITEEIISISKGYNVKLKADMSVTLENLLYGVLCGGGNDAANAIAIACSGEIDAFVSTMNEKSTEWGLNDTHFTNPTGIDDSQMYSTLADIMIIAKRASENELYMKISSAMSYVYTPDGHTDEIKFFNRNALISNFYMLGYRNLYAMGMISGNTDLGGYCVITYAEKHNTGYICAVMGADGDQDNVYSYKIANELIEYAFDNYNYVKIAEGGQYICDAPLMQAMPDSDSENVYVKCVVAEDVYALTYSDVSPDTNIKYRYYLHDNPTAAPVYVGDILGGVDIIYNGEVIGNAKLIAAEEVEASQLLLFLDGMKNFFSGRIFIFSVIFFVLLIFLYNYLFVRKYKRKNVKNIEYKNYY